MKKYFYLLPVLAFMLGCSKGGGGGEPTRSPYLDGVPTTIQLDHDELGDEFTIETNRSWTVSVDGYSSGWLSVSPTSGESGTHVITVKTHENQSVDLRRGTISVSAASLTPKTVAVTQTGVPAQSTHYADGQVVQLQAATEFGTNDLGVNIVVMGDGYTSSDMLKGTGKYEKDMREAMDSFFSVYPYDEYRNYFNVYMVAAVSAQSGVSIENGETRNTKFSCVWAGQGSTAIRCDDQTAVAYARRIPGDFFLPALPEHVTDPRNFNNLTVIMPINADIYAGTCIFYNTGFSVAMCPVGEYFGRVVTHEAGGHGFAKLCDEYIYNDVPIPAEMKDELSTWKRDYGFYPNIDFTGVFSETTWGAYAGLDKYTAPANGSPVGTYEGAYMYSREIWRPEQNSCMNDNIPYYNAPSRWAQVKRISDIAGLGLTFDEYVADEVIPAYPVESRAGRGVLRSLMPLGTPIPIDNRL